MESQRGEEQCANSEEPSPHPGGGFFFIFVCYNRSVMSNKNTTQQEHTTLYRKYRPNTFDEVMGQDHIVSALQQAAESGKPAHAYLFSGSRGVGKTSIARIFARALGTSENDIYEMDAASNTGVDNMRELSEAANTLPFNSKYKVYILDEVHMLSKSAFNAFLKTLEEPPRHVIFILATTETNKVPETVISRCQHFAFRTPTVEVLRQIILHVAKSEKIKIATEAVDLVAILGDGSFRDTLGILQKVGDMAGGEITREAVENITGSPRHVLVSEYVNGLLHKKPVEALDALSKASVNNANLTIFADLALMEVRSVIIVGIRSGAGEVLPIHLRKVLASLLNARARLDSSSIQTLPLELAILETSE